MPSFDIVSEVDAVEINNAVANARRTLDTRFDFRGVEASFDVNKDLVVTLKTESDFQVQQLEMMLRDALAKRNVDAAAMELDKESTHSGKLFYREAKFQQGIDQPTAKLIVKLIKGSKIKVQAAIQGDQLRVTGKKRDDLQAVMALLREEKEQIGQPLQFKNFRD